jgi:aminopeptidase N
MIGDPYTRSHSFYSMLMLLLVSSLTRVWAQDLLPYPYSKSRLAAQQEQVMTAYRNLISNPLMQDYDVKFYGLDVIADNRSDRIKGSTRILVEVGKDNFSSLVFDLYGSLDVDRVLVDGEETSFTHANDELQIDLSTARDSGQLLSSQIFYGGQTGPGMVMERDDEWGVPVSYTSSEPFYSRDWFPCKQDLKDKADSVHVFISTDFGLMGVSNGLHTGTTYFPNGKVRYEWKSSYPIDYYLISIAVADYREFNLEVQPPGLGAPIFIQNFVYDVPGCLDTYRDQIQTTLPIMEVFCQYFGPYPHREEKYGHYLWPRGGGMEHQTMTGMGHFEFYLVAHELGHSWFGNYVTCATWQDIWINEGFATFAGYLATEILGPEYAEGEREFRFDRALLEPEGTVFIPEEDAENPSRIFSGNLSYNKGMALLYMIRYEMQNDALFYLALRNFLDRYANNVATGMDFKEVLEETSGMDFTEFFEQWYFGAGFPIYEVEWEQQGDQLTIHSTQSTSSAQTPLFKMSMEYTIYHVEGDTTVRVFHDENVESFQFQMPYTVVDIGIDTRNMVLDGQPAERKKSLWGDPSEQFIITPNPSNGTFFFSLDPLQGNPAGQQVQVEVLDLSGRTLFKELHESCLPYLDYQVKLRGAPAGIYVTRFTSAGREEVHKILVQ